MKRKGKWSGKKIAAMALAVVMLLAVAALPASAGGFLATGKTVAENEASWGKPVVIQQFDNGTEKRFYKYTNPAVNGYRTFVYKDGKTVDDGAIEATLPEAPKAQPNYRIMGSN